MFPRADEEGVGEDQGDYHGAGTEQPVRAGVVEGLDDLDGGYAEHAGEDEGDRVQAAGVLACHLECKQRVRDGLQRSVADGNKDDGAEQQDRVAHRADQQQSESCERDDARQDGVAV